MSNSVQLTNFTDFDRLLGGKNLVVTLLGAAAAFTLGYLHILISVPVIPYNLTLSLLFMILVSVYTANIASVSFVVLVGSMGFIGPKGELPYFFLGYLLTNLLICLTLGYYANKLQLVMRWNRFYHLFALVFALFTIGLDIVFSSSTSLYTDNGIEIFTGNDLGTGTGLPIMAGIVLVVVFLLVLISSLVNRGQLLLTTSSSKKYTIVGYLFIILGHLITIVPLLLYSVLVNPSRILKIASFSDNREFLTQTFFTGTTVGIFGGMANIFYIMPLSVTLICLGINFKSIGKNRGNLEGMRGNSDLAYLAAPFAILFYFIYGSYYIQHAIDPIGVYVAVELFPIFAAGIWVLYLLNQIGARLVLFIIDLI